MKGQSVTELAASKIIEAIGAIASANAALESCAVRRRMNVDDYPFLEQLEDVQQQLGEARLPLAAANETLAAFRGIS